MGLLTVLIQLLNSDSGNEKTMSQVSTTMNRDTELLCLLCHNGIIVIENMSKLKS